MYNNNSTTIFTIKLNTKDNLAVELWDLNNKRLLDSIDLSSTLDDDLPEAQDDAIASLQDLAEKIAKKNGFNCKIRDLGNEEIEYYV